MGACRGGRVCGRCGGRAAVPEGLLPAAGRATVGRLRLPVGAAGGDVWTGGRTRIGRRGGAGGAWPVRGSSTLSRSVGGTTRPVGGGNTGRGAAPEDAGACAAGRSCVTGRAGGSSAAGGDGCAAMTGSGSGSCTSTSSGTSTGSTATGGGGSGSTGGGGTGAGIRTASAEAGGAAAISAGGAAGFADLTKRGGGNAGAAGLAGSGALPAGLRPLTATGVSANEALDGTAMLR